VQEAPGPVRGSTSEEGANWTGTGLQQSAHGGYGVAVMFAPLVLVKVLPVLPMDAVWVVLA
jgi:hypothetical protein